MGKWIKRIVAVLLVGFVAFFVIAYPTESATALKTFGTAIKDACWRVYGFFASLG